MKQIEATKGTNYFLLTYDEYGSLDTVQTARGELLSSKNRDVKVLVNNADSILAGKAPKGWQLGRVFAGRRA